MSWCLTGEPAHEWRAAGLPGLIVAGVRSVAGGESNVSSRMPVGRGTAPARAGAPFVMRLLLMSAAVVTGRKALKLRLE